MQDIYDMNAAVPEQGGPSIKVRFTKEHFSILLLPSWGECRNIGMIKILSSIYRRLRSECPGFFDAHPDFIVEIVTADYPIAKESQPGHLVFQTVGSRDTPDLFPDYVFGNWWHIGLTDFDKFAAEILEKSRETEPTDERCFWMGNEEVHQARQHYKIIAAEHPGRLTCETMTWVENGSKPTRFVPLSEQHKYKYLLDIEGLGWSGRLKLLPFCCRPILVQNRPHWSWSDQQMTPEVHYRTVERDFSNLLAVLDDIDAHPEETQKMVETTLKLARTTYTFENIVKVGMGLIVKAMTTGY
jgi:hypothetical protein